MLHLTAYFDESGTHGDSPVTVMGGVLANARQWARFGEAFAALKRRHGFAVFHTKKFKAKSGDFAGWSDDRCMALLLDVAALTEDAFTGGVTMSLDNASFDADYRDGEKPRKLRLDSKYGLCFRQCLIFVMLEAMKRQHRKKLPRLDVVMESGHRNVGDATRIFDETKRLLEADGCDLLGSLTVVDKDASDPLMMADFIAHTTYLMEREASAGAPRGEPAPVERGRSAVTHLRFGPDGLVDVKEQLVAALRRRPR